MNNVQSIYEIYSRCIELLDRNLIDNSEYYGWPQYLPYRDGDIPGLCGTSYAILTYHEVSFSTKKELLKKFNKNRLLITLNSKMDENGGFMVDTHRPIPTTDACWEGIMDMLALEVSSGYLPLNLSVRYLLNTKNVDGGWGISEVSPETMVFPTTQVVSLFSILLKKNAIENALMPLVKVARKEGVDWLLSARNHDNGWGNIGAKGNVVVSTAANTARAIVALLDAGMSKKDEFITNGVEQLRSFVSNGHTEDDYIEVYLHSEKYNVPASKPKLFRYSNFTEAWILYALLISGVSVNDAIISKLVNNLVSRENGGFWQDKFNRYDTEDGRVEWKLANNNINQMNTKSQRVALWPIYNNILALRNVLEIMNSGL